jgi:5-methylcytosine-specific restriction endonuclease McrA
MSQTRFDNITRSALWTAYNNICFYCNRPLDWDDLNIDHIIPESLNLKPEILNQIRREYELIDDFDLNALYNLVPTHVKCNSRKSDELFVKKTTLFYLGLTNKAIKKIEAEIQKLKNRKNKGQIISKLQTALAINLINTNELESILIKVKQDNWINLKIKLPHGLEFIDEVYDSFYLNSDCSKLYDKKLRFGAGSDYVELSNNSGNKIIVSTLREWKDMTNKGYHSASNADIKMSSSFTFLEELIEALYKAKMPKVSFISEPWIEINNLHYLSPNILIDSEGQLNQYISKGISIGDLVKDGIISQNDSSYYKVSLEYKGMETSFIEQFRADFNNDGIEDIFVRGWTRAVRGTIGYGFTTILTRYSDKHLIEEIK